MGCGKMKDLRRNFKIVNRAIGLILYTHTHTHTHTHVKAAKKFLCEGANNPPMFFGGLNCHPERSEGSCYIISMFRKILQAKSLRMTCI